MPQIRHFAHVEQWYTAWYRVRDVTLLGTDHAVHPRTGTRGVPDTHIPARPIADLPDSVAGQRHSVHFDKVHEE